jgi:Na+/proline symporter
LYSYITLNHTGVVIGTFLIVGLLMTIISCGSSFAMNGVTVIANDFYMKTIKKNASDKEKVHASRVSVVIVTIFGVVGALWVPNIAALWVLAQALALGGLLCPVLSAWFWKRSTSTGALWSCILGGVAAFAWAIYSWMTVGTPGGLPHGLHCAYIGLIVGLPVMIIVSLATKPEYEKHALTSYKTLGDQMKAEQQVMFKGDKPGFFGTFLGAKTPQGYAAWIIVIAAFFLHFICVAFFKNEGMGFFTIWFGIFLCLAQTAIFGIAGAFDMKKFFTIKK